MKPFIVEIKTVVVVMANDGDHAQDVALSHAREAMGDDTKPSVVVTGPVLSLCDLTDQWDGRCIPYGDAEDRTLAQILGTAATA